ncbi:MAG: creatininase family protein [Candidatus Neomarinimicrobiota bacterium]|nr:creatininase family protein [Candidatus Neomarinimicrobiota bacterium]
MKNGLFLDRMRSPDIAVAIAAGTTNVIVPCGTVGQHGPHFPFFTDAEHGRHLGTEVAEKLGNTLLAPNGILGNARGMPKEIDEKCLSAVVDVVADHFRMN